MSEVIETTEPIADKPAEIRRRFGTREELILALLPTTIVLIVFGVVQAWSKQELLFASLASSAFLIYLDPKHATNSARTLVISQILSALIGFGAFYVFGPGYLSAASAMVVAIVAMVSLDAVHPPAVSTALAFGFRSSNGDNLTLFVLSVFLLVLLVGLQRVSLWLVARAARLNGDSSHKGHEDRTKDTKGVKKT